MSETSEAGEASSATGPSAREKLLDKAQTLLAERGRLSDLSLRRLAEHLGTSHRMLAYYFGSRDGLLAALLAELGKQDRQALLALDGTATAYAEGLRLVEERYLDPARQSRTTAFFYVLGLAAQDPDTYREFLDSLDRWVEVFTTLGIREGHPEREAHARAFALVWAARGIALEAATGDRAEAVRRLRDIATLLVRPPASPLPE